MRDSAVGDVGKIWVWAMGSLLGGIWLTPLAFNGGKAISELSESKDFNGVVNRSAAWSGAAGLEDFFMVCWPLVAVVLFFPTVEWLSRGRRDRSGWQDLPGLPNQREVAHALAGFFLAFGCFLLAGYLFVLAGGAVWSADGIWWGGKKGLWMDAGFAMAGAAVAAAFFGRVVPGVFRKAGDAVISVALAALAFAGIRYVFSGFQQAETVEVEGLSGFRLVGILLSGGDLGSRVMIHFLPWFAFGCLLGQVRWSTRSLWLPVGLLTGWILAARIFARAADPVASTDRAAGLFSAFGFLQGVIPLLGVAAIGWTVRLMLRDSVVTEEADE